ncbi:hypothetical protein ABID65_007550 [Bradyrhizobium sp. S3.9.2]|uniref:hypothetical protein n=1 Tax=Bradyrhizobium sp. S3.9.2 TaxID=3156432 RepID=UPI0033973119
MAVDRDAILIRAQAFVDRKYTTRADARQKAMGLAYVEAERTDLAREIRNFALTEIAWARFDDDLPRKEEGNGIEDYK